MSTTEKLNTMVVGYQVRGADGAVVGEVQGVRPRGLRLHKIPGHARHAGYLPAEAIARVDTAMDTIMLRTGITLDAILDAPAPPDEGPDSWHVSGDWWADLLGHYGLFEPEGRAGEPFLHADQK